MTAALARVPATPRQPRTIAVVDAIALLAGLAVVVSARWIATRVGLEALWVGAAFGLALVVLWRVVAGARFGGLGSAGPRFASHRKTPWARATLVAPAAGIAFGIALVAVTIAGASIAGAPIVPGIAHPAAPLLPWAAVTILVATGEEGILRGVLFDRLRSTGGTAVAVVITSIAFALLHVPLYGWEVVPLDLAVGLGLAGLRLSTRTVLAPVVAHAVADLATWWL